MRKRNNTIKIECPKCHDINRSVVKDLICRNGSSTIIRTRICKKCGGGYFTCEKLIEGYENKQSDLRKSFRTLTAQLDILRNKVLAT
jgi:transcriptional regulator NrdR family protein